MEWAAVQVDHFLLHEPRISWVQPWRYNCPWDTSTECKSTKHVHAQNWYISMITTFVCVSSGPAVCEGGSCSESIWVQFEATSKIILDHSVVNRTLPWKVKLDDLHNFCMFVHVMGYSSCDLIGQLPLDLRGDVHQIKDHAQFDSTINGLLLLQKSNLLLPALTKAVCLMLYRYSILKKNIFL